MADVAVHEVFRGNLLRKQGQNRLSIGLVCQIIDHGSNFGIVLLLFLKRSKYLRLHPEPKLDDEARVSVLLILLFQLQFYTFLFCFVRNDIDKLSSNFVAKIEACAADGWVETRF